MAFAVHLATTGHGLDRCPHIGPQARGKVQPLLQDAGDWRELLADELVGELPDLDPQRFPVKLGVRGAPGRITLRYLGDDIILADSGFSEHLSPWDRILILRYLLHREPEPAATKEDSVSFRDLRGGMVKASAFRKECEDPLAKLLEEDLSVTTRRLEGVGARPAPSPAAPVGWDIDPLPAIHFRILFWPREEGFPSECRVLLNSSATSYLDVESLIFLGERLVARLEAGTE